MPRFCKLLVVLLCFISAARSLSPVPEFVLNLDLPPTQRWNGAVKHIVDLHGWNHSFGPVVNMYLPWFQVFPAELTQAVAQHLKDVYPDVYGEMQGIAAQLAAYGCSACNTSNTFFLFAYYYEIAHVSFMRDRLPEAMLRSCTAILSLPRNASQDIIHGRNMDESPKVGRNLTLHIRVFQHGVYRYSMLDWTWLTAGIATASRIGGVTLEMNWNNDGPALSLEEVVARILSNTTVPVLQSFRVINDANMSFDEAITFITTQQWASPFYNIVSGTGRRGAVLTIEYNASNDRVIYINDTSPTPFLVQTNYDHWLPDPASDPRRTVAEETLAMEGPLRSGSELGVWMALSVYPVHNAHTMFSALMTVSQEPEAYIRVSMKPSD